MESATAADNSREWVEGLRGKIEIRMMMSDLMTKEAFDSHRATPAACRAPSFVSHECRKRQKGKGGKSRRREKRVKVSLWEMREEGERVHAAAAADTV